jgi:hypothetical protein
VIVVVVVLLALALDSATPVFYYRPINDYALAVGTVTGNNTWTRVTGVNESAESVTVYVKSMRAPLPGTGDDTVELTVRLTAPLGGRSVIDGSSGVTVARLKVPIP